MKIPGNVKYILGRKDHLRKEITKFWITRKKPIFTDMAELMFGFGDCEHPLRTSAIIMENLSFVFINDLILSSLKISKLRNARRPKFCDVAFHVRNKRQEREKIEYLVKMKQLIDQTVGAGKNRLSLLKNMK